VAVEAAPPTDQLTLSIGNVRAVNGILRFYSVHCTGTTAVVELRVAAALSPVRSYPSRQGTNENKNKISRLLQMFVGGSFPLRG